MADELARANSRELEIYGELSLLPKAGVKIRLTRESRLQRVIDSAAEHAELSRGQLDDRLEATTDRARAVVASAVLRATEVDDEDYIDALGRLIAGALDSAAIDELAFVTSEITKLEPVHLRALLGFFWFGREGNQAADPDLSPVDAAWATNRHRTDRDIKSLLNLSPETTSQVLRRLDRDGLIRLHGGPVADGETTSSPSDWAGRVVSMLFPTITVEFRDAVTDGGSNETGRSVAKTSAAVTVAEGNPEIRERRAIEELAAEIKKLERQMVSPLHRPFLGDEQMWLATLKRRLRSVDPDNPWAYGD